MRSRSSNTIVQLSTPRWVVGRAVSFYQTASFGGMAAGSWLWGSVAESSDAGTALSIAAIVTAVGVLIGFFMPMPVFEDLDLDPLDRFREPDLNLEILPRSGPIAINIDYEIADQDVAEFLKLMVERRRIRIRDGAQAWALMRDLENPHIWTENYHTPTWVEYVATTTAAHQGGCDELRPDTRPASRRRSTQGPPHDRTAGHPAVRRCLPQVAYRPALSGRGRLKPSRQSPRPYRA